MTKTLILPLLLTGCLGPLDESSYETETDVERQTVSMRIDFGQQDGSLDWQPVNDNVMGGESIGVVDYLDTVAVFEGTVSTDNNGGFVSLRSPVADYDLSPFTEVEISYRATGHSFKLVLADAVAWWMPTFEAVIAPTTDEWTTTVVSLYDFRQYEMSGYGEQETGAEMTPEYLSEVLRIDLMNKEFADGDFVLEVDYIEFRGYVDE